MSTLTWQTLNLMQIFDVLRSCRTCHLAADDHGQPWCVMMHYQLEVQGAQVILHLATAEKGRKLEAMADNELVCVAVELPSCAWMDTVILTGRAVPAKAEDGVRLRIKAGEISGRRYFLSL